MLSVKRITTNLLQALIAFNLTTRPIAIIGTRRYKKKCWICQVVPTLRKMAMNGEKVVFAF